MKLTRSAMRKPKRLRLPQRRCRQDLTGRGRKTWLQANASAWGVSRLQGRQGKYTNKLTDQLQQEISAKIHGAWSKWFSQSAPQVAAEGGSSSSSSAAAVSSTLLASGAAEHTGRRAGAGTTSIAGDVAGARPERSSAAHNERRRRSQGYGGETQMFSAEDSKAKAALEWLQNQSGQATADVLLAQIAAWENLLAGDGARSRSVALAKSHGISVPRSCQNALRDGRDYHIIRDHFLNAINQGARQGVRIFPSAGCQCHRARWCSREHTHPPRGHGLPVLGSLRTDEATARAA